MVDAVRAVEGAFFPEKLTSRKQWLVWRFEQHEGEKKPRKVPYYVSGRKRAGKQGSDEDRAALVTHAEAAAAVAKGKFTGMGFAFLPGDGLIGIDIDGAFSDDPVKEKRALGIIQACASFTEYSPSGKGVHIFVEDSLVPADTKSFKDNGIGVEVFRSAQFFTMTGNQWPGSNTDIVPIRPEVLDRLRAVIKGKPEVPTLPVAVPPRVPAYGAANDDELSPVRLESALSSLGAADYHFWVNVGMALKASLGEEGFRLWDNWSSESSKYPGTKTLQKKWDSFGATVLTVAFIYRAATDAGWKPPKRERVKASPSHAASPAPAIPAGGAVANGDAGGEASSRSLAYLLAHCRFIAGKRDVWDDNENVKYSWSSIRLEFGDAAVKEWAAHADRRKNIPDSAVRAAESKDKSGGLLDRLRLIVGGLQKEVWDNQRRCRLPLGVVETEFPNEFEMWHKSPARSRYDIEHVNIVFDPTEMVDTDLFVNTFKGLPLAPNPVNAKEKADAILKLVLHLCNNNQDHARWMLQWMAFPLINRFKKKHGSALLVYSNIHGSGKSLLFERIYSEIFGEYSVTAGSRELESQYTGWRSGKLYCLFEEVLTPKEKLQQAGNIKHMITANKVLVSEKFISTWEEANHMAVTFLSNELRPLPIEPYDRRLFVIWPESKLLTEDEAESQDVLVTYEMILSCIENGGVEAFHSVLLDMDMTGFDSYRPPMTPAKERLIRHGRSSADTFVALWSSKSLDYAPFCSCTTPQLVAAYKYFCQQMNMHASGGSTLALHAEALPGVVVHDRKHWRFMATERQQPMYVVGQKPANVYAEKDWLGESQEQFRAAWVKYGPNVN